MEELNLFSALDMKDSLAREDFFDSFLFKGDTPFPDTLVEKEFYKCRFEGVDFTRHHFVTCRFENCYFKNCNLSLVNFKNSDLVDVKFDSSKLIGIDWREAREPIRIALRDCKMNNSIFVGLSLQRLYLLNCEAAECDFQETNLRQSVFTGTDFRNARFVRTDLYRADFIDAVNYSIDPTNNNVKKAKFVYPEVLALLDKFDIEIE